jgi:hypothetical protein
LPEAQETRGADFYRLIPRRKKRGVPGFGNGLDFHLCEQRLIMHAKILML